MTKKRRYWAFIVYPESAPLDWRDILQATGLPYAISPLHDKDINPDNTPKKSHYHVIATYPGPTTFNCVREITESVNSPAPIGLDAVRGYFRYFTHLDNPEKYQYSENDITTINDFDISNYNELTYSEIKSITNDILKLINDNDILEYCDLLDILLQSELFNYLDVACSHTILFNTYLCSKRNKSKEELSKVSRETYR